MSNDLMTIKDDQLGLLRDMFFKGATQAEFEMFVYACQRTGLDPFMKQIYPVKRWDSNLKKEAMTVQTGIDGYRLIAERTGKYAPGPEPTFTFDEKGNFISATAYVKKQTKDGTWHTIAATAFFDEYCQKTKEGKATSMWQKMPKSQTAKCAESLALRKAFPNEMSGIYTKDEMEQAECEVVSDLNHLSHIKQNLITEQPTSPMPIITAQQGIELSHILHECDDDYQKYFLDQVLERNFACKILAELPAKHYDKVKNALIIKMEENHTKQQAEFEEKGEEE
jgi:phage recombination protein Bet